MSVEAKLAARVAELTWALTTTRDATLHYVECIHPKPGAGREHWTWVLKEVDRILAGAQPAPAEAVTDDGGIFG